MMATLIWWFPDPLLQMEYQEFTEMMLDPLSISLPVF